MLSPKERLVLVAMFKDYLQRSEIAYPRSRNETSEALNKLPGRAGWTWRKVEHTVAGVRRKVGVDIDSAHPERLRENLIDHLLETGSLVPSDLALLDEPQR